MVRPLPTQTFRPTREPSSNATSLPRSVIPVERRSGVTSLGRASPVPPTAAERAIGEYNTGVFCFRTRLLKQALAALTTDNAQGEYYLTDTVAHLVAAGHRVAAVVTEDPDEVVGINTVDELAAAARILRERGA